MTERVRVSVRAGEACADLALPGHLPVADLEPEVAALLGAGGRLTTLVGRALEEEEPLAGQVRDGDVLLLVATPAPPPLVVHDDPAAAIAAVPVLAWSTQESRAAAHAVAVSAFLSLAVGLWVVHGAAWSGALVLATGAVAQARGLLVAVPALVGGGVLLCLGLLARGSGIDVRATAVALAAAATLAAGGVAAWSLALSVGDRVRRDEVRAARRLGVSLTGAVAVLLTGAAAVAPATGGASASAVACCALLLGIRARHSRAAVDVAAALVAAVVPVVVLGAAMLATRPAWHPVVLMVAAVGTATPLLRPGSPWTARLLDVTETLLVVAIPLLVAVAVGLPELVRR